MIHESVDDDAATDNGNQDIPSIDSGNDHQEHSSSIACPMSESDICHYPRQSH